MEEIVFLLLTWDNLCSFVMNYMIFKAILLLVVFESTTFTLEVT